MLTLGWASWVICYPTNYVCMGTVGTCTPLTCCNSWTCWHWGQHSTGHFALIPMSINSHQRSMPINSSQCQIKQNWSYQLETSTLDPALIGDGQPWSKLIGTEKNWSALIGNDQYWLVLGSMPEVWLVLINIDRHWALIELADMANITHYL